MTPISGKIKGKYQSEAYYRSKAEHIAEVLEGQAEAKKMAKDAFNNCNEVKDIWNKDCSKCYHRFNCDYRDRGLYCNDSFIDSSAHDKKVKAEAIDSFIDLIWNGYSFETLSKRALKVIFDDAKKDLLKEQK